jgi:hypothetical protein
MPRHQETSMSRCSGCKALDKQPTAVPPHASLHYVGRARAMDGSGRPRWERYVCTECGAVMLREIERASPGNRAAVWQPFSA